MGAGTRRIGLATAGALLGTLLSACGTTASAAPKQLPSNLATVVEGAGGQVWAEATSFKHGQIIAGAAPGAAVLGTPQGTSTAAGLVLSEAGGVAWAGEVAHGTLALSAIYTGSIGRWKPQVIATEIPGYPGAIAATARAAYAVVGGSGGGTNAQELVRLSRGGAASSVVLGTKELRRLAAGVGCAGVELRSVAVVSGSPMVLGSCAGATRAVVIDASSRSPRAVDAPAGYTYTGFSALVVAGGAPRFAAVVESAKGGFGWVAGPGAARVVPLGYRPTLGPSLAGTPGGTAWLLIPGARGGSVFRLSARRVVATYAAPPQAQGIGAAASGGALVVAGGSSVNRVALYQLEGPRFTEVRSVTVPVSP